MPVSNFPYTGEKVIIVTKGLPYTLKSGIAKAVGQWARCPVLYMTDSINALSLEKGYSSREFMPPEEEAHRLYNLAFDALCTSARRYLSLLGSWTNGGVVIKSRLFSTFELDRLVQLSRELPNHFGANIILIIECHVKNEHRLCKRLERIADITRDVDKEWYKAWSRLDFETMRDDLLSTNNGRNPEDWDLYIRNLVNGDKKHLKRVMRLVLDPFNDLGLGLVFKCHLYGDTILPHAFQDVIHHLLIGRHSSNADHLEGELLSTGEDIIKGRYEVVQFREIQRYLVEKELQKAVTSRKKSKYHCPTSRPEKWCIFHSRVAGEDDDDCYKCGVCDEPVISEGYTCYFCILTLHKSCAEHNGVAFPRDFLHTFFLRYYPSNHGYFTTNHACKSCEERGKSFSDKCYGCLFQTHLQGRMLPTIVKHDSHHEHFLSLQVGKSSFESSCKACGFLGGKYGCYVCGLWYCLTCVLRPGQIDHIHGGHEHVLKLVYSREEMELKEDYWCSICHMDMDPDYWFYSCTNCPFYEACPECITSTI